jgi:hypothetical protein
VNYSRPRSEIKSELVFSGEKEGCVKTRWKRFYQKQMENVELRGSVGSEAENLQLGVQTGNKTKTGRGRNGEVKAKTRSRAKWFAAMDGLGGDPLLKKGRKQPPVPRHKIFD